MIDFGDTFNPKLIFGACSRHILHAVHASMFFDIKDAASIAIIGAADGPTSIVVAQSSARNISAR